MEKPLELHPLGSLRYRKRKWVVATAKLRKFKNRGTCATPNVPGIPGYIIVSTHLPASGPMREEAFIHETLHAALPQLTENEVVRTAKMLAKVLRISRKQEPPAPQE